MAQTIPNTLPSKSSKGEQRLFEVLRGLPDDVVVYYEPIIDNRHPDFVVILPTLGVLLIEVKGWFLPEIVGGDSHSVRVREGEREVEHVHPLRQVSDYKFLLMKRCAKDTQISKLVNLSGPYTGKFQFPFASFAILSNITRENLNKWPERSRAVFPSATVATSDQLKEWEAMGSENLMTVLKGYFDTFIAPMTKNQVNIVKAILHPEILLGLEFTNPAKPEEPTVKVLDLKQEALARDVGEGHRLVFGVAGSGKTVLLIARAKLIARLNPEARVLVLCYNVTLGTYLAESLSDCPTVTVTNFHRWAWDNGVNWDSDDDSELGEKFLAALKAGGRDSKRFDTVLIDEAQDFDSTWFPCVLAAMKDPANGELLIVGDGSQGLYRRRKVSWKQLGIQAQGRTQYLEQNYRNTRPIIALATRFASGRADNDEDGLSAPLVDPNKCVRIAGSAAVLLTKKSKQDEVDHVVRVVDDLLNGLWFGEAIARLRPEQIGILYRMEHPLIGTLREELEAKRRDCPVIWLTEKGKSARRRIAEPGVKILTMHGAKGLQFKAVILLFADECPLHASNTDETEERRLFYVALTRAEDFLVISCSGKSKYVAEIEAAEADGRDK